MNTVSEFKSMWDESTAAQESGNLKLRDELRELAKNYAAGFVSENDARLSAQFGEYNLEELVAQVDFFRDRGWDDRVLEVEMWLLTNFEPQNIGGTAKIQRRKR